MANLVFLKGLLTNWEKIQKDKDTFYIVQYNTTGNTFEKYCLYLGDELIADGNTTKQLEDISKSLNNYVLKSSIQELMKKK